MYSKTDEDMSKQHKNKFTGVLMVHKKGKFSIKNNDGDGL